MTGRCSQPEVGQVRAASTAASRSITEPARPDSASASGVGADLLALDMLVPVSHLLAAKPLVEHRRRDSARQRSPQGRPADPAVEQRLGGQGEAEIDEAPVVGRIALLHAPFRQAALPVIAGIRHPQHLPAAVAGVARRPDAPARPLELLLHRFAPGGGHEGRQHGAPAAQRPVEALRQPGSE
jgi:hypothetical protein